MIKHIFTVIAASVLILQTLPSSAQKDDKDLSFALFASDDIIEASIYFDLGVYLRKNLKGEGLDGRIIFNRGSSDSLVKDIRIKTRGVFRQQYCGFPPMEINFKKPVSAYKGQKADCTICILHRAGRNTCKEDKLYQAEECIIDTETGNSRYNHQDRDL